MEYLKLTLLEITFWIGNMFSLNNKKINKKKIRNEDGFVVLIAVLVSGLLITVGIFIANIAIKEIALSNSSKDSQKAFYAADAAAECVLFQDIKLRQFSTSSADIGAPTEIICNDDTFPIENITSDATSATTIVRVAFIPHDEIPSNRPEADRYPFAIVSIEKNNVGTVNDETIIRSRGFNIKQNSQNRVERSLQINY